MSHKNYIKLIRDTQRVKFHKRIKHLLLTNPLVYCCNSGLSLLAIAARALVTFSGAW